MTEHDEAPPRQRDLKQEERERLRFDILKNVYERHWSQGETPVRTLDIGLAMGLSREELLETVQELTQRSYLSFSSPGPQVSITEKGVAYMEGGAGQRRSIRDP